MHRLCLLRALPFFTPNQEQMWGHPEQEEPAPHCRTHLQEPQPQIHVPAEGQHLCRAAWGERASLFPACPSTFPPIFTRTQPSLPSIPISTPLSSQLRTPLALLQPPVPLPCAAPSWLFLTLSPFAWCWKLSPGRVGQETPTQPPDLHPAHLHPASSAGQARPVPPASRQGIQQEPKRYSKS